MAEDGGGEIGQGLALLGIGDALKLNGRRGAGLGLPEQDGCGPFSTDFWSREEFQCLGAKPIELFGGDDEAIADDALLEPLGVETLVYIKAGERTLVSSVPGISHYAIGDAVRFNIVRERLHYFAPNGARVA